MSYITLTPAYGRDYTSVGAIKAALDSGKDFIIADVMHPYCGKPANKSDLAGEGVTAVNVRYAANRKVAVIKL